jgi:thiol-disulfide isomerase/thioredoxin
MAHYRRPEMTTSPPKVESVRRRRALLLAALAVLAGLVTIWIALAAGNDDPAGSSGPVTAAGVPGSGAELAPDFAVPTKDGGTFSLADHLAGDGRPVLLNLWASWCPPCRAEMPAINAAAARHPEILFVGVAVSDSSDDATAFTDDLGISYLIGFDENDEVGPAFRAPGLPATYLISPDGRIVKRILGQMTEDSIDADLAAAFGG